MCYASGSQPFPSRGPLDKFCLGSRTTKNDCIFRISDDLFSHFPFKFFLGYIGGRMQNIGGWMHGPSPLPPQILGEPSPGPPKRIFQIFPISLHFSGSRTEKTFNFHLQASCDTIHKKVPSLSSHSFVRNHPERRWGQF